MKKNKQVIIATVGFVILAIASFIITDGASTYIGNNPKQELPSVLTKEPETVGDIAGDLGDSIKSAAEKEVNTLSGTAKEVADGAMNSSKSFGERMSSTFEGLAHSAGEEFNELTSIEPGTGSVWNGGASLDKSSGSDDKASEQATYDDTTYQKVKYIRTVDGDTIKVDIDGTEYSVRLIGVNTPESVASQEYLDYKGTTNSVEGKEASNFTKELLQGYDYLYLQKDISETDRYGRLLRYVWLSVPSDRYDYDEVKTKMLNGILVYNKVAEVATYEPDTEYANVFFELYNE